MGQHGLVDSRAEVARRALDDAFAMADEFLGDSSGSAVGLFGNGLPETLISAHGVRPVHVNFGQAPNAAPMDEFIEPFVDIEVRIFLNRFAAGAFDGLRGIVFARDDAAALTAYQYATEWVRQGRSSGRPPRLFLFNLVHATTAPVAAFNRVQLQKLQAFLADLGFAAPSKEATAQAVSAASRRRALLDGLVAIADPATSSRWRNAGRFMATERHAQLLELALVGMNTPSASSPRLALVGSPIAAPAFFRMLARFGELVCDLQAFGHQWPGAWETQTDIDKLLATLAADPFSPRISPPQVHRKALVDAIIAASSDLVICRLAQTDDTFGWEVPRLAADLAERGIGFVNLGFCDPSPDADWLDDAGRKISSALESVP